MLPIGKSFELAAYHSFSDEEPPSPGTKREESKLDSDPTFEPDLPYKKASPSTLPTCALCNGDPVDLKAVARHVPKWAEKYLKDPALDQRNSYCVRFPAAPIVRTALVGNIYLEGLPSLELVVKAFPLSRVFFELDCCHAEMWTRTKESLSLFQLDDQQLLEITSLLAHHMQHDPKFELGSVKLPEGFLKAQLPHLTESSSIEKALLNTFREPFPYKSPTTLDGCFPAIYRTIKSALQEKFATRHELEDILRIAEAVAPLVIKNIGEARGSAIFPATEVLQSGMNSLVTRQEIDLVVGLFADKIHNFDRCKEEKNRLVLLGNWIEEGLPVKIHPRFVKAFAQEIYTASQITEEGIITFPSKSALSYLLLNFQCSVSLKREDLDKLRGSLAGEKLTYRADKNKELVRHIEVYTERALAHLNLDRMLIDIITRLIQEISI
jgi:hypothetical protein